MSNPASSSTPAPRRRITTEKLTRRKRVIIACQFCRLRKTRCDGVRPVCGFCQHHNAQCIWGSTAEDSFDATPTEQEILRRLDELKALLADSKHSLSAPESARDSSINSAIPDIPPRSPTTVASQQSTVLPLAPTISPYAYTRCERLLSWPIFQGVVDPADSAIESFVLDPGTHTDSTYSQPFSPTHSLSRHRGGPGVQDHLFVPLCRKFLAHVHTRNPILEGEQLIRYAKYATEHGLEWDGPSCLVLIACALACYTAPFELDQPQVAERLREEDIAAADAYYFAAKKRLGLLHYSLTDIQCLFFASVYEKYALKPLQAWFYIQQASSRLQAHLKQHHETHPFAEASASQAQDSHLVPRVFWSVFKAEHELITELPFRSSGIEELTRADSMFPSPPTITNAPESSTTGSSDEQNARQEERSWFFYLAEISMRRTINETLWLFYRNGEGYWLTHVNSLVQHYKEAETQVQLWYSHLPASISFDAAGQPDNELSFYLQGRFNEWRDYILRPLLYYVYHRPAGQTLSPHVLSCAQEMIYLSANNIVYNVKHHRHGGTWFVCRRTFSSALCILGAAIRADPEIPPPQNWDSLLTTAISTIQKWEAQSKDLQRMRIILERTFTEVYQRVNA